MELNEVLYIRHFIFFFDGEEDSATVNKIKQNVHALKENQLI